MDSKPVVAVTAASVPAWRQDEYLRDVGGRLTSPPSDVRVISFDFFDTLVCRLCADPADLFIEVGRQLAQRGMLRQPLDPMEFKAARQAADERAREAAQQQGKSTELRLADIYAQLGQVVTDAAAARDVEWEIERSFCYLNPAVASLAEHARRLGYKTAVVSDTYFTVTELQRLLRDNGCDPALFDAFLVSCERGYAKWNGTLFHDLLRHFDVHASEVLHLGDNPHADVAMARQIGIQSLHYPKTTPVLDAIFQGEQRFAGAGAYLAGGLHSLRALVSRQGTSSDDAFQDGALTFGPVLARYADWCVEKFRAAGVRTVFALMREGELLGELVQRAANAAGVELHVVPCFASRLSTARAALGEVTPQKAAELIEGCPAITPQAVLDILGMGQEGSRFLDASVRAKPLGSAQEVAGFLTLLFKLPKIRELLEARRAESHALAFDYFSALAGDAESIGMIDLGWSGSIQRNITRILRRGGRTVRSVGCYLARTRRSGRLTLDGDVVHAFMEQEWARSTILAEIAITATVGSTERYVRLPSGEVQPVLGAFELAPAERTVKTRLRDGVLAFQQRWIALRDSRPKGTLSPAFFADLDRLTAPIFYRLLEYPTQAEAARLGGLTHDENYFGANYTAPLCDEGTARQLRREGVGSLFQNSRCYWPQGVVARANPRLISALRATWNDPVSLGALGAWHGVALHDAGITDQELSALGYLVNGLAIDQVIYTGTVAPVLEEVFLHLWEEGHSAENLGADQPRLLLTRETDAARWQPAFRHRCALPSGPLSPETLERDIRAKLDPLANIALVLTPDLAPEQVYLLLHLLAPFLGPQGLILGACGRCDRHNVQRESPLSEPLNSWHDEVGRELGFGLWPVPHGAQLPASQWIVFRRATNTGFWNRQWMVTMADLFAAAQVPTTPQPLPQTQPEPVAA